MAMRILYWASLRETMKTGADMDKIAVLIPCYHEAGVAYIWEEKSN